MSNTHLPLALLGRLLRRLGRLLVSLALFLNLALSLRLGRLRCAALLRRRRLLGRTRGTFIVAGALIAATQPAVVRPLRLVSALGVNRRQGGGRLPRLLGRVASGLVNWRRLRRRLRR